MHRAKILSVEQRRSLFEGGVATRSAHRKRRDVHLASFLLHQDRSKEHVRFSFFRVFCAVRSATCWAMGS